MCNFLLLFLMVFNYDHILAVPDLSAPDEPEEGGKIVKKQKRAFDDRKPTTRVKLFKYNDKFCHLLM